jgi:hypothetical protein
MVPDQPLQTVHKAPISKITRAKWTGGMSQVVEHQLCKCKALSSNPSPMKIEKLKGQCNMQRKYAWAGTIIPINYVFVYCGTGA